MGCILLDANSSPMKDKRCLGTTRMDFLGANHGRPTRLPSVRRWLAWRMKEELRIFFSLTLLKPSTWSLIASVWPELRDTDVIVGLWGKGIARPKVQRSAVWNSAEEWLWVPSFRVQYWGHYHSMSSLMSGWWNEMHPHQLLLTTSMCCNQYTAEPLRRILRGSINVLMEALWRSTKGSTGSCTWNTINMCKKGWVLTG